MLIQFYKNFLNIEKITIPITGVPHSLNQVKIIQLSDFHYDGISLSTSLLMKAIQLSNAEKPDLILLTGDYITNSTNSVNKLASQLNLLTSKKGVYAVLGNHDTLHENEKKFITQAFSYVDIKVLCNEIAYPLGEYLPIVGLADYWSQEFNPEAVMQKLSPSQPRLVLSHNPDTASILKKWRVDLQLSGHTHGGQIIIPGFGPCLMLFQKIHKRIPRKLQRYFPLAKYSLSIVKNWKWGLGLHSIGKNKLYVNRGLGTYSPGRFFCSPELTIITLINSIN